MSATAHHEQDAVQVAEAICGVLADVPESRCIAAMCAVLATIVRRQPDREGLAGEIKRRVLLLAQEMDASETRP